jgi:hypothetical protein
VAKAGKVRGIHARDSLTDNARKVVRVRLADLLRFASSVEDASLDTELHDLRIAAKRLRYSLELFAPCFSEVKPLIKEVTALQEDIGAIHDLDVLVALLRARIRGMDQQVEEEAIEIAALPLSAPESNLAVRSVLSATARDKRRLGLMGLIGDKVWERRSRFTRLSECWGGAVLPALVTRLEIATGLRAGLDETPGDALEAAAP